MTDDKTILIAEFGTKGVKRVYAAVTSIADGALAAEVFQTTGLAIRLAHESLREHFSDQSATQVADPLPVGENDLFVCLCGDTFTSTDAAITHVERHHASARIRRDLDKLESTIEGMIFPNPLPPVPENLPIIKDRTFGAELIEELSTVFTDLKIGDRKAAIDLVKHCAWDKIADLNYDEAKVRIIDHDHDHVGGKNRIQPPMHETYLTAVALFLSQVGKLSKTYRSR
jgi:hypothetical protein